LRKKRRMIMRRQTRGEIFSTYQNEIGVLTPLIGEKINAAIDGHPI
jgi:hypothetical protein